MSGIGIETLLLRNSRLVLQGKKCQPYGDTHKYCVTEPRNCQNQRMQIQNVFFLVKGTQPIK